MTLRYRGPRAQCDLCGGEFYHHELRKQMVHDGRAVVWSKYLRCRTCFDPVQEPSPPLRQLTADPVTIFPPGFNPQSS